MKKSKLIALILALTLAFGSVAGGTIAWLIDDTQTVTNTFTYGDIDIKLEESVLDEDGNPTDQKTPEGNSYEMIPGEELYKDPTVTVLANSENCWLFVKLVESDDPTFSDYLTYHIADDWVPLDEDNDEIADDGVYYRYIGENTADQKFAVLQDNKVTVKDNVTKEMLNALDNNGQDANASYPALSITAYAVQYSGFEPEISEGAETATDEQVKAAAAEAWKAVQDSTTTP